MVTEFVPSSVTESQLVLDVHCFSIDDYHRMIDAGILTKNDRVELLSGVITEMLPIGSKHATAVLIANELLVRLLPKDWHVRVQLPITLADSEPEPDLTIVSGKIRDYADRHPVGDDIGLVVEISDSSLQLDRTVKAATYAEARIECYWIINLSEQCVEAHHDPKTNDSGDSEYKSVERLSSDQKLTLNLRGRTLGTIKIADLLP